MEKYIKKLPFISNLIKYLDNLIALLPAFLYYLAKRPTENSIDTLCMGYHVTARRGEDSVERDME